MNEYYTPEEDKNPNGEAKTLINEEGKIKIPDFVNEAHHKKTSYK